MNSTPLFSIKSNDGWNAVSCHCDEAIVLKTREVVYARLSVKGQFWDRSEMEKNNVIGELVPDFETNLFQIRILKKTLVELCAHLRFWIESHGVADCALSECDPLLKILIGPRENFISTQEKPVFTIVYSSLRFSASWSFVVDESCIRQLLEDIEQFLQRDEC